jgi:dihydrofolate reductase
MKGKRKVVLYIAQSLDGYIAGEGGDISWLDLVAREGEDYGYGEFIDSVDTVIMGRKTYDKVMSLVEQFPHTDKKCFVLSRKRKGDEGSLSFYSGNVAELVWKLKNEEGKDIFVDGGAEVVREFVKRDLIDEYVISIVPVILGSGIRLFLESEISFKLNLASSRSYESGLVQLKYERGNER